MHLIYNSLFLIKCPWASIKVNKVHYYSTIASVYHIRRKHIHAIQYESIRVYRNIESVLHCSVPVSNHSLNKSFKMVGKYCSGIINIIQWFYR